MDALTESEAKGMLQRVDRAENPTDLTPTLEDYWRLRYARDVRRLLDLLRTPVEHAEAP